MFLSDTKIREFLDNGKLDITPAPEEADIRPNSIRIHLGEKLIKYRDQLVDPMNPSELVYDEIDISVKPFILNPGEFVLGSTVEAVKTPRDLFGLLDGRSTLARLGLTIHISAAITDSLYEEPRTITLEIHNAGNMQLVLSHEMPIGAMLFAQLDQEVEQETQDQYKGQNGVTVSNIMEQLS